MQRHMSLWDISTGKIMTPSYNVSKHFLCKVPLANFSREVSDFVCSIFSVGTINELPFENSFWLQGDMLKPIVSRKDRKVQLTVVRIS